jgi:uncharacterized protein (UPF0335 family)
MVAINASLPQDFNILKSLDKKELQEIKKQVDMTMQDVFSDLEKQGLNAQARELILKNRKKHREVMEQMVAVQGFLEKAVMSQGKTIGTKREVFRKGFEMRYDEKKPIPMQVHSFIEKIWNNEAEDTQ